MFASTLASKKKHSRSKAHLQKHSLVDRIIWAVPLNHVQRRPIPHCPQTAHRRSQAYLQVAQSGAVAAELVVVHGDVDHGAGHLGVVLPRHHRQQLQRALQVPQGRLAVANPGVAVVGRQVAVTAMATAGREQCPVAASFGRFERSLANSKRRGSLLAAILKKRASMLCSNASIGTCWLP